MKERDESRVGVRKAKRADYRHERKKFISEGKGHYRCHFAEAAYELGDMYRKGIGGSVDMAQAYYYYLQAEYAVVLRLQVKRNSEDEAFVAKIRLILAQMRKKLGYGTEKLYCSPHPFVLYQALEDGHDIMISFRHMKSGRIKIIAARIPKAGAAECKRSRMLVTYDRFHYCELKDFVITYAQNVQGLWCEESEDCIRVDTITLVMDPVSGNRCEFYYHGKLVAYVCAEDYVVSSGRPRYFRF